MAIENPNIETTENQHTTTTVGSYTHNSQKEGKTYSKDGTIPFEKHYADSFPAMAEALESIKESQESIKESQEALATAE